MIHHHPGVYNDFLNAFPLLETYSNLMTSRAMNVYSSLCKDVVLNTYMCPLTVTIFLLPYAMGQIFGVGHAFQYSALKHNWKALPEVLTQHPATLTV